jgi:hypothetical protein
VKTRILLWALALGLSVLPALTARAEHFDIDLSVEGAGDKQEAHRDDYPPFEGRNPRPVFHGKKGELLQFQFLFKDANPHEALKRVSIRYYLVAVNDGPLKSTPLAGDKTILSGNFVMDFKFEGKLGFKQKTRITEPGRYLLRAESSNSAADHEHFAAIELDIR